MYKFHQGVIRAINDPSLSLHEVRDLWRNEILKMEDADARKFFMSIWWRLNYERSFDEWQMALYKSLMSMADRKAKDVWIVTGYATLTAIAYGYFEDPSFTVVFKELHSPSSQLISWNRWKIKVLQEDFRNVRFPLSDLWIATILADLAFWEDEKIKRAMEDETFYKSDLAALGNLKSGQECVWSWPYGGTRMTFTLLFDYPHPLWHNKERMLERWQKLVDIKEYREIELPDANSSELDPEGKLASGKPRHFVKHLKRNALLVRGIKK